MQNIPTTPMLIGGIPATFAIAETRYDYTKHDETYTSEYCPKFSEKTLERHAAHWRPILSYILDQQRYYPDWMAKFTIGFDPSWWHVVDSISKMIVCMDFLKDSILKRKLDIDVRKDDIYIEFFDTDNEMHGMRLSVNGGEPIYTVNFIILQDYRAYPCKITPSRVAYLINYVVAVDHHASV